MGQIENMLPQDVEAIQAEIMRLKEVNPDLKFKTFPMEDLDFAKRLTALEEKVDSILTKLNNIFGDYVLINGKFQDILNPKPSKE